MITVNWHQARFSFSAIIDDMGTTRMEFATNRHIWRRRYFTFKFLCFGRGLRVEWWDRRKQGFRVWVTWRRKQFSCWSDLNWMVLARSPALRINFHSRLRICVDWINLKEAFVFQNGLPFGLGKIDIFDSTRYRKTSQRYSFWNFHRLSLALTFFVILYCAQL